ncbi:MAG: carbonic anhydrase [Deltaproteobacteria bacterium]|nr:carbonic anhydrase [Deltaproteobacteria bacterium]
MVNHDSEIITGKEALQRLLDGNRRYVGSRQTHPDQEPDRRLALRAGQHPFAVILGCADSRVPPEVIFDQGLGDLFVIRVAGNVLDDMILGSMEYAEIHLNTPLIMVLGHSQCGAVEATVEGGQMEGHISSLTSAIQPAVDRAKDRPGSLVNNAVKANAKMVAENLKTSGAHFTELVSAGRLLILAAYYDLETGIVEILES